MASLTSPTQGHDLIPTGDGWFDKLARVAARDVSRRDSLRLAAGVTAGAFAASWFRPRRAEAVGDAGCAGTRTPYTDGCAKPVAKQNYTASFNGCGKENGVIAPPQRPLNVATFTPACNTHDVCYGTCNTDRSECDSAFFTDMATICVGDYPTNGLDDILGRALCLELAATYTVGVRLLGGEPFAQGQREGCDCCEDCPGGAAKCGDRCCGDGQECSNGACCSSCGNYIKCSFPAPAGQCDFGCCNPTTICCPNAKGIPRCCPADFCCNGVCTKC